MAVVYHRETNSFVSTDSIAYKELFLKGKTTEYDKAIRAVVADEKKRTGDPTTAIERCRVKMLVQAKGINHMPEDLEDPEKVLSLLTEHFKNK